MGNKKDSKIIKYRPAHNWKYQLLEDFSIRLDKRFKEDKIVPNFIYLKKDGWITIKAHYCWDGCTFPAIQTKRTKRAGALHDALYQLFRAGLLPIDMRDWADRWFKKILIQDKFMFPNLYYKSVSKYGLKYAKPQKEYDVLIAP